MKNNRWNYPEEVEGMKFKKSNQRNVLNRLDSPPRPKRTKRYLTPVITAVALVFIMFASILYVPSLEPVLAKIPFISQYVQDEEERREEVEKVLQTVNASVKEQGYELAHYVSDEKGIELSVKDEEVSLEELATQVENALDDKGLGGYKVEVVPTKKSSSQPLELTEEEKANEEESKRIEKSLTERLEREGYELMFPVSVRINDREGIYMNIIVTKEESRMDQLEMIAKEEAESVDAELKLDIRQVEKKAREQEKRWDDTGALNDIAGALVDSGEYPVTGFSYSFHPYPLVMKVKTSLEKGSDEAAQIAEEIHSEVEQYIQNGEGTEAIRDDTYNLMILDKNEEEID
ncbi:hypothetical protein N780_06105 [Pontibacillus chungwhensis BH030062]|uniref:DUF4030 domain-containing protein n=1 Tax=Pontibacillus chungwhensis BH030062 TaxID=1385513 RepID=A0A0A2UQU0_9BACI|nr:DUF4179 domain-containing protein [Pontibacillus chungwhensis]KGP90304.1 hypothetical protein N780_06105 [Pontibacillus chungwhensis BH030062]